MLRLEPFDQHREDVFFENLQSETMPKIREFRTSNSPGLTTRLLHAKRQDGRPAFNFMDLRRLSMSLILPQDQQNILYLLQNAKLLEELRLSVDAGQSLVGILSTSARTLKVLDLAVFLHHYRVPQLAGLCEELEAMMGDNILEALFFEFHVTVGHTTEDFIGSIIRKVENILVKPGWSALRQVSFKFTPTHRGVGEELSEALQSLPDKYLSHLSKLESVTFNFSVSVVV